MECLQAFWNRSVVSAEVPTSMPAQIHTDIPPANLPGILCVFSKNPPSFPLRIPKNFAPDSFKNLFKIISFKISTEILLEMFYEIFL